MKRRSMAEWVAVLTQAGVSPGVASQWAQTFSDFFVGDIFSTGERELPDFLSQIVHESGYLRRLEENLSYSAKRLTEVWPSRFPTLESARPYEHKPQALANKVYGGRLGNYKDGDGWAYRGSGLIQITGRANFEFVERQTGLPVVQYPYLLRQVSDTNLKAAVAWWEGKVPDALIGQPLKVRKAVNGGTIGSQETIKLAGNFRDLLGVNYG